MVKSISYRQSAEEGGTSNSTVIIMRLPIPLTLLTIVFVTSLASIANSQDIKNFGKCPVEYGYQGTFNFAKDSKARVTFEKLKEISPTVRNRIMEQLNARVGSVFVKRLELDFGYAHDFDIAGDLSASDSERIDGYDMVFYFSDKGRGLSAFRFKVVADGSGRIIDDLSLPDIASDPKRAELVSCKEAREIAAKNGFPLSRTSIYFIYDWDSHSFTWMLSDNKAVEPDEPSWFRGKGTFRKMLIEAHTGKVLKIFKETIIV